MSRGPTTKYWGGDDSRPVVLAATSLWNGLAANAYHLWALRRAEMTAFTHSPFKNLEGNPVVMAQVRQLEPRSFGTERMLKLLRLGLGEMLDVVASFPRGTRLGVTLGLPERMSSTNATQRDRRTRALIEQRLVDLLSEAGADLSAQVEARGHAAGVVGVLQAADAVLTGACQAALVAGIDSYYDPFVIQQLLDDDRILDSGHLDAMVPGEGAAFALITTTSFAKRQGLTVSAVFEGASLDEELATRDNDVPMLGLGLSRPAVALGDRLRKEGRKLDWWISDMTPEELRVHEFELAWPRASRGLMHPASVVEHLPTELGDLGAATIPTALAVVAQGFLRGDPDARSCMVTASSDGGDRGVLLVSRPE